MGFATATIAARVFDLSFYVSVFASDLLFTD